MSLIPLRLTAEGQIRSYRSQVLGSQVGVVLPEIKVDPARLETPYSQEMEKIDCLTAEEAGGLIEVLTVDLTRGELDQEEMERTLKIIEEIDAARCE